MSKILIIEDELSIAELERDYLELNDFEVEIETNGLKGLEKALDEEYSLILLDLMLPEVDGFEICRQIREKKDIPIIMVTAKKNDIDKIRGLGLGVDDYVTKPFSPSELVARVKAHISRYERLVGSTALKNDVIEIRGLKIDKTDRRVYVDNEEKVFTNKEFDILCFLASNPNKVFSNVINRALTTVRSQSGKRIRETYNVKQADISSNQNMKMKRASGGDLDGCRPSGLALLARTKEHRRSRCCFGFLSQGVVGIMARRRIGGLLRSHDGRPEVAQHRRHCKRNVGA